MHKIANSEHNRTHPSLIHAAGRLLAATALLGVGFVALAFLLFLIALNDIGRVLNAWALFFLALLVALGLRLAAWVFRSRLLVRAAVITAVASPARRRPSRRVSRVSCEQIRVFSSPSHNLVIK